MESFERLIVEQIPRLRRYAQALTGERMAADDLVQGTLARAIRKRHLWIHRKGIRPWLFTIMHNLYVNDIEKRARAPNIVALEDDDVRIAVNGHPEAGLLLRDLGRALGDLPPEQRAVVLLVGLEQFSYKDTGRVLGIPIGTVMSRLSRSRDRLRELMSDSGSVGLRRVK